MTLHSIETRIDDLLVDENVDAIVASSPANIRYLSGTLFQHLGPAPSDMVFVIWAREGQRVVLVPDWCEPYARSRSKLDIVGWRWNESLSKPIDALARQLEEMQLAHTTLGVEREHLSAQTWTELESTMPAATLVGVDRSLADQRIRKTQAEMAPLTQAAAAGEAALRETFAGVSEGVTEREFARALREATVRNGAEVQWLIIAWGTPDQHQYPRDLAIQPGELIAVEFGCSADGYLADLQRTAVVPPASAELRDAYQRLWGIHERIMRRLEPGRRISGIYRDSIADMQSSGLEQWTWYLGHGIGLTAHEQPWLSANEATEIQPGMVFALEPAVLKPTFLTVEDIVAVGDEGPRFLSVSTDWSQLPELGQFPIDSSATTD